MFAEGQASVVAAAIIARHGGRGPTVEYDGHGQCYLEFGHDRVARVDVTFAAGHAPTGFFEGPSQELADHKTDFGSTRIRRWFGREWAAF